LVFDQYSNSIEQLDAVFQHFLNLNPYHFLQLLEQLLIDPHLNLEFSFALLNQSQVLFCGFIIII